MRDRLRNTIWRSLESRGGSSDRGLWTVKRVSDGKLDTSAPHVVALMMNRFKGKEGERNIILELSNMTRMSDLRIR